MADFPFPRSSNSSQGTYPPGFGPLASPDNPSGQTAPAGPFFGADNPVVEQHTSPASTGGFRPSPERTPLPTNPMDGFTKPPGRNQR